MRAIDNAFQGQLEKIVMPEHRLQLWQFIETYCGKQRLYYESQVQQHQTANAGMAGGREHNRG
ncbi:MAG: hypothetical protein NVSMB64_26070 [Candidatus Velthaea sp.]